MTLMATSLAVDLCKPTKAHQRTQLRYATVSQDNYNLMPSSNEVN